MRKIIYTLSVLTLILVSCNNKSEEQKRWEKVINDNVNRWNTKDFVFPKNLRVLNDIDSQAYRAKSKPFQLVIYIDGTCGVCVESLIFWQKFLKEIDFSKANCGLQMYIYSDDPEDFQKNVIEKLNITYPWLYDRASQCIALNGLNDKRFQTALINADNKVILIGNPVMNPTLKELYSSTIKHLKDSTE